MKILVGSFQCESNTFCDTKAQISDFEVYYGEDALDKLTACEVFEQAGAQIKPLVFASALPSGVVSIEAYRHFEKIFVDMISKESDVDGIYLYLHGSMYVEGLGSGEELLAKAIRAVVGQHVPITVALDFHANLSAGFIENVNGIHGFRTAPHTDHDDTERRAAKSLLKCIKLGITPHPAWVHVPFLGGDASVTSKEPFLSVTSELTRLDSDERIVSCALFNAQPWYDSPYTGACAVVSAVGDSAFDTALSLAKIFWDGRENLTLDGAMQVEQAVAASLQNSGDLVFVTDSGDNTTAGAYGAGTLLLNRYLEADARHTLICGILDADATEKLMRQKIGDVSDITLALGKHGAQEIETALTVTLKGKGIVYGWAGDEVGEGVLIGCKHLDVVLTNARAAFTTPAHFAKMGVDPENYNVVVVKMGYLFPRLREISDKTIFALTPGQSTNDFSSLTYRRLKRKMFPIHKDITWESIEENAKEEMNKRC